MSGGGGSSNTTTTTQTADPWSASQPYLKEIMANAKNLYGQGQGFNPFPNSTVVPFSNQTMESLGGIENMARGGDPLGQAAQSQALGVLGSGGMSDWQRGALGGAYDVATGASGIGTEGDYRGLLGQAGNPYWEQMVDREAGKVANDTQRSVDAMGRTGSGYNTNEVANAVGDFRLNALANRWDQNLANQRGILGDITGVQGQNIANRVGAGQGIFSAGDTAAGRAAQYAGLTPSLYQQGYAPMERLASVGSQYEDLAGRSLQDQIDRYSATQQAPWSRLSQYSALAGGPGALGGTKTETSKPPTNFAAPLGGALGGAGLASMLGLASPWGLGLAGAGGLLGLLGSGIF